MTETIPILPRPFALVESLTHLTRQTVDPVHRFVNNIIYNETTPIPYDITVDDPSPLDCRLIRTHLDAYLYYIETRNVMLEDPPTAPFQIKFPHNIVKTISPADIYISIADVFKQFLAKVQERNNQMDISMFRNSSIDTLRNKAHNFYIQNLETKVIIQDNPNHWLQTYIHQIQHLWFLHYLYRVHFP